MTGINNYLKNRWFILSVIIFILLPAYSQKEPVVVEKSNEKVIFQGKVVYLHTVKKGQTLYSICKAYSVSESEISQANQGISLSILSEGQTLKIPTDSKDNVKVQPENHETGDNFYYHTVQPKQTLYYIYQKYNVPLDLIYKYNPGVQQGIQTGQVIRIPKNQELKNITQTLTKDIPGVKYQVRDGDTLYVIANKYGVSISDIINANAQLRWGLKQGQTIIIPTQSISKNVDLIRNYDSSRVFYELPSFGARECDSISELQYNTPVRVALLLPFYTTDMYIVDSTNFNDTLDDGSSQAKPNSFRGKGAVEFYEGLLLAIDTLKQQGTNIQLYTYDTEGDSNKVKSILKEVDKIKPSLIIGPFMPENVRIVSKYSQKNGIPFVPPLMNDDEISRKNTFLFQVNPSMQSEIITSANYLSQFFNQNIILAHKPGYIEQENINLFKKMLRQKSTSFLTTDTFCFQEVIIDGNFHSSMRKYLLKGKKNIFILLSNNEPEVSNILSQLYFSSKYFDIEVFGLPQWQKFTNVSIEHMHELRVTLFSPYFIDYSNSNTKNFIIKCRNQLGFEPFKTSIKGTGMNYSFLGYDIGIYFIKAIGQYGNYTTYCTDHYNPGTLLLSDYKFERAKSIGCIENTSVNLIKYNKDFSIEKIRFSPISN